MSGHSPMTRVWASCLLLVLLLGTIGCDRTTKRWASTTLGQGGVRSYLGNVVVLEYTENAGAFLSLGSEWPPRARLMLFTVAIVVPLVFAIGIFGRDATSISAIAALALFLGGGVSNFIDRLTRGTVIDFINVGVGPVRTGIFNVADVAIMAGAALALFAWSRTAK